MKQKTVTEEIPRVVAFQPSADVREMMRLAKRAGFAGSWGKIANRATRHRLQQEFHTKHVQNIQSKMRETGDPIC